MFKIYIVPNELSDCIACFTNLNGDHLIITPSSILKCGINCNLITYSNKASGWAAQTRDSTSNSVCSCRAFSLPIPTDPGLDLSGS